MKWYNKVFRNERNDKDTIIDFNDLDYDVKVIIACCADGLLPGDLVSSSYSESIDIEVLRSHNSYICYLNGVPFCDVLLKVVSDFFFDTYDEQGRFEEVAAQIGSTDEECNKDERTIVYDDDHHIRLTREELEIIKSALIHYADYKDRDLLKSLDYLLSLLDRVLGRGYDSSVVHLSDYDLPF